MDKNFDLKNVTKLSASQMKDVKGGVSREEYCNTLRELWDNNLQDWDADTIQGWWYGYKTHCLN